MAYSSSLTDKEWEIIEPLLPKKKRTKPPTWSKREILDGVFYQLKNGTACEAGKVVRQRDDMGAYALYWCDLPPYSTVFWHYKRTMRSIEVASSDALGAYALRENKV